MKHTALKPGVRLLPVLVLACAVFHSLPLFAADAAAESPDSGKPFAQAWRLKGEVTVTDKNGDTRQLNNGGTVFVGEKVSATSSGEAVLQTGDAGIVAVRPGAQFVPERFAAEGKKTDHQVLRLITGSLRVISGWIGLLNSRNHRVVTPTATIGIRGTDHEPYVLPAEKASNIYPQGTYDKVNRGATVLDAYGGNVAIDSGKVGFARAPNPSDTRTRALMTLLLPVLLSKIPDFYVPGAFDQELDHCSASADATARKQLEKLAGRLAAEPIPQTLPAEVAAAPEVVALAPSPASTLACSPRIIGEVWLARLDRAIARRDIKTILGMFAPEIVAKASVKTGSGISTLEFSRSEMVLSILNSIASLKDYQQRRVSIEAALVDGEDVDSCNEVSVKSIAVEQGLMNGKVFRFESLEDYLLEQRHGEWLAIMAQTTQR